MDTKFSVAVHVLILISASPNPINSDQMAESVGTNAGYIRKIPALLKKARIVDSPRGIGGYSLSVAPEQLTLLQVYQAVTVKQAPMRCNAPSVPVFYAVWGDLSNIGYPIALIGNGLLQNVIRNFFLQRYNGISGLVADFGFLHAVKRFKCLFCVHLAMSAHHTFDF